MSVNYCPYCPESWIRFALVDLVRIFCISQTKLKNKVVLFCEKFISDLQSSVSQLVLKGLFQGQFARKRHGSFWQKMPLLKEDQLLTLSKLQFTQGRHGGRCLGMPTVLIPLGSEADWCSPFAPLLKQAELSPRKKRAFASNLPSVVKNRWSYSKQLTPEKVFLLF